MKEIILVCGWPESDSFFQSYFTEKLNQLCSSNLPALPAKSWDLPRGNLILGKRNKIKKMNNKICSEVGIKSE